MRCDLHHMGKGGIEWRSQNQRGEDTQIATSAMAAIHTRHTWRLAGTCGRLHVTEGEMKMKPQSRSTSSRDKVRAHRKRLRQQGLRPLQIWVPDMRSPAFVTEAHRQSLAVAKGPHAKENQDFIDAISDGSGM